MLAEVNFSSVVANTLVLANNKQHLAGRTADVNVIQLSQQGEEKEGSMEPFLFWIKL